MERKVLQMNFVDTVGKNFRINITEPKDNVNAESLRPVMEGIIGTNAFANGAALKGVGSALVVVTKEEKLI